MPCRYRILRNLKITEVLALNEGRYIELRA
jgi:hypothetical protein